jgi:hypothetical protein
MSPATISDLNLEVQGSDGGVADPFIDITRGLSSMDSPIRNNAQSIVEKAEGRR